eukprot:TRINITY_DN12577_c0_g1_i3.p1 TRINITY_DN12577_c0_g1~~TRINITY_DN12577_c0_g1_i3.p1  ORF type:complete len:784 (-),score=134.17 TRINITY_DN12577_c0_g1_i3:98-2449(-)
MMHEPFAECEEEPPQQDEQKQEEAQPALPQQPQQPPQASPRLPPGQGAVTLDGWYFTSAFDSGNALPSSWRRETSVPRQQANGSGSTPAFSVEIARDCHGNPRVERRKAFWFYFGVMPPDPSFEGEVKFTVRRISPTVDLYAAGHKPWVSSPSARPWRRVAGEASAGPSPAHDQWDLSWRYRFDGAAAPLEPGVDGTTYFAFCAPYGYSELLEWLDRVEAVFVRNPGEECDGNATLQQGDEDAASNKAPWLWHDVDFKAGSGIYCHRQVIAISPMGRRVDLITVTETVNGLNDDWPREELPQSVEDALRGWKTPEALSELAGGTKLAQDLEKPHPFRFPGRAVCFFSGRVHPGETPAQWAINGLLRFVLSDDPRAAILRRRCVFKIVPMLNPDGVALGHTRTSSLGYDLNRCYRNPAVDQHESVFVVKEMLLGWASRGDLLLYVDCHAHTSRRGCFLFGNLQSSHPWASKDSLLWNLAYAHTLQLNSPHLDIDGCEWTSTTRLYHAYTVECNYHTSRVVRPCPNAPGLPREAQAVQATETGTVQPEDNDSCTGGETSPKLKARGSLGSSARRPKPAPYCPRAWVAVGEALAVSLLDLHGLNPHSRLLVARPPKPLLLPNKGGIAEANRLLERLFRALAKRHHEAQGATRPPQETTLSLEAERSPHRRVFKVVSPHVNIRDRPSKEGKSLGTKKQGDTVLVVQVRRDGWVHLDKSELTTLELATFVPDAFMLMHSGVHSGINDLLADTGNEVEAPETTARSGIIAACVAPLVEDVEAGKYPLPM